MENIFQKVKKELETPPKKPVSVTLDVELIKELKKIKKEEGIKKMSPIINTMLWDWVNAHNKVMKGGNQK